VDFLPKYGGIGVRGIFFLKRNHDLFLERIIDSLLIEEEF
jgi:hypothetical protein